MKVLVIVVASSCFPLVFSSSLPSYRFLVVDGADDVDDVDVCS